MPELPEVETVRRGLAPVMEGAWFRSIEARRPDLRWPLPPRFAQRLLGNRVERITRRAKYLLVELSSGEALIMHLGMSGSFRIAGRRTDLRDAFHHPRSRDPAHDHVVFGMSSGATITFNDPRRFGFMLLVAQHELDRHPLMRQTGPEPLNPEFDAAALARSVANRSVSLKAALLDQKVVAGLGNIYACEALNRARLSPRRRAATLATAAGEPTLRAEALVAAIKDVLTDAIGAGGSSLRDHRRTDGELGSFQHAFRVYDRAGERCRTPACEGRIRRFTQNGRSTFYCPACQR